MTGSLIGFTWMRTLVFLLLAIFSSSSLFLPSAWAANVNIIPTSNLAAIDSNTQIDSGLTIGFNGAYPSTLSEGGICFLASGMNLRQVKFNLVVTAGSPLGTFNAQVFASTGTIGNNCKPTGSSLATSNLLVIGSVNGDTSFFVFSSYFDLQAGTTYAVSIRLISCVTCNNSNYWSLEYVNTDLSITNNIYYWNNPYAFGGPHSKLKYEIDGSPVVQFKNAYGYVDVTNTQIVDTGPNVYPNGTIFLQVSNSLSSQIGDYTYQVISYGNGTLTIRFKGPRPFSIQTGGHAIGYNSVFGTQDIQYAGGDAGYGNTGVLVVSYRGITPLLRDATYVMALLTPIVLVVLLADYLRDPFSPERPLKMKRIYYSTIALVLATATLFILSSLFS